jgi:KUP system potassium uptake protein
MTVRFTSAREMGQIYMPAVNWALLAGVVLAVLVFGSSSALAGAYGIAVTLTMMITTVLTFFVVRHGWHLPAAAGGGGHAVLPGCRCRAGGRLRRQVLGRRLVPAGSGLLLFGVMSTWSRGRARLLQSIRRDGLALQDFMDSLDTAQPAPRRTHGGLPGGRSEHGAAGACCTTSSTTRCCTNAT